MFIRFAKRDGEAGERALLVARRKDDSREYIFAYDNDKYGIDGQADLTVCDFEPKNR